MTSVTAKISFVILLFCCVLSLELLKFTLYELLADPVYFSVYHGLVCFVLMELTELYNLGTAGC